jgi:hypothetical protein
MILRALLNSLNGLPWEDPTFGCFEGDDTPAGDGGGGDGSSAPAGGGESEGGSGDVAPPDSSSAAAGAEVSDPEWNGELESLRKEQWYADLPEERRSRVEAGLRVKHRNWQRGYQGKMEAATKAEADLRQQLEEAKKSRDYFSEMLGETDATKTMTDRITGLEKALSEKEGELVKVRETVTKYEKEAAERATNETLARYEREYPDIYADFHEDADFAAGKKEVAEPTGAYVEFVRIVKALGGTPEAEKKAAKMVRAAMKEAADAADPPAEKAPRSVRGAGSGGGPRPSDTTSHPLEDYATVMARERRAAEAEANGDDDDE